MIIEKYTTESEFSSLFRLKKLHSDQKQTMIKMDKYQAS